MFSLYVFCCNWLIFPTKTQSIEDVLPVIEQNIFDVIAIVHVMPHAIYIYILYVYVSAVIMGVVSTLKTMLNMLIIQLCIDV